MSLSREFFLAGQATFTIGLPADSASGPNGESRFHYTYRIEAVEASDRWAAAWFVKLLTAPDTYTYLGKLDDFTGQVRTTARSAFAADAYCVCLLNRILARVWGDDAEAFERHGYTLHHEGACAVCGRPLTTPESCERGIGPVCWEKIAAGDLANAGAM